MKLSKYSLAVLVLLGASEPAYAHGEQIGYVLGSHLFVLVGMGVFLLFYPAHRNSKRISFLVLILSVLAIWVIPGPGGILYYLTMKNVPIGILVSMALPTCIGLFTLTISMRVHKRANQSLHRTREDHARQ